MTETIRVLHVDDEPEFADLTATCLEREDERFAVTSASDVGEALDRLADADIDCVVSDYDMPGRNGIELLESVRAEYPDLPFILYTGKGSEEVASEAVSAGVTEYMQKDSGTDQYTVLANRITNSVDQYRAERVARETRERLQQLTENVTDCLWMFTPDFEELLFVSGYESVWGRPTERIEDDPTDFLEAIDPEYLVDARQAMDRLSNGESVDRTLKIRTGDGETGWVWVKGEPVFDESGEVVRVVGFTRDVTGERERTEQLQQYGTIVEALSDAVYVLDEQGQFVYVNERLVEMVGYERETILGKTPSLIKDEAAVRTAEQQLGRLLSSDGPEAVTFEVTIQPRDGDPIVCEDHMGVLPYEGDSFEGSVGTLRDITERKERQRQVQMLKTQYETLTENFPAGAVFLINEDLEYVRAGGRELGRIGLSPEDIEGKQPHDLFPEEIAEETRSYYRQALDGTGNTFEQEYRGERYRIQTAPVRTEGEEVDRAMAVSQNITEYAENRERLRRRDEQLSRLHDATRDLFDAESPEQAAEIASRAAEDILELPLNGIHFYDDTADGLVPVTVSDQSREVLGEVPVIDGGIAFEAFQTGEFRLHTDLRDASNVYNAETPIRSEMYIPIGGYGVFLISSRQVDAFTDTDVELARTLAANTTAALERISREAELQTRKDDLLQKNERLDEFASIVSHDLRSPLTVAEGNIELAREDCDSDYLGKAADAIGRSQALIEDILTLAREGETVTEREPVELADVAEHSWDTVDTPRATLDTDTTRVIRADRSRLQELFENLYRNAVEHGGDGVTVHVGELDGGFYVADTGSGIPESDRDEVFEAGYSTTADGTGFGLRIVEQITEAHGWEIDVTESDWGGARFEVTGVDCRGSNRRAR